MTTFKMLKGLNLIIIIMMVLPRLAYSQVPEGFPFLNEEVLPEAEYQTQRTFTGESLFGYMNGGAELYLEYGFERLQVTEINYKGNDFKIEIYHMNNPEAAFGIYSVSLFKCTSSDSYGDYSCQSQYQLQVCRGDYYINIINNRGSSEEISDSEVLLKKILNQVSGGSYSIEPWLQGIKLENEPVRIKLFKGDLGLYNGAYDWYEHLRGMTGYVALLFDLGNQLVLSISFENQEKKRMFIIRNEELSQMLVCTDETKAESNIVLFDEGNRLILQRKF